MAANGEILKTLKDKIALALDDTRLRKADRVILEIQQLFIIYLQNDHEKIEKIYPFVMAQQASTKEKRDSGIHYTRLAVGTAITSVVVMLLNWVYYYFQVMPGLEIVAKATK